uniref:Peptidase A1 domain-containing protein n=1 Tax=Glycine max TaxID=3847 RepID=K7K7G8_SOYBN
MSSHPSLFSLSFFLLLSLPQHSFSSTEEYLKLPLLPRTPLPSPSHLLAADLRRLSANSPLTSGAPTGSGQYFASLRLGSPPQRLLLVADTGSDLIWTLCRLVPPPPSSKNERCNNHTKLHTPCHYQYSYADGSTSTGFFSKETISLNTTNSTRQTRLNKLSFGCAFRTSGPSVTGHSFNGAQGVMGLGRGPISFTSQLARKLSNTKTKNTFSYCLLDYTLSPPPTSYLTIGPTPNDVVSRNSFTYTPLLTNPFSPSFYYISIQSVSVDGVRLPISESVFRIDANGNGGTVVDSGTTLSFLAEPAYGKILAAFRRRVRLPAVESAAALGFDLCVNVSGVARPKLPRLRFRLAGKAVLSPPVGNYFIEPAEGVKCLAVQPVRPDSGFSVIGNLMQQGYLFEFDLDRSRIGFTRHGCAVR